MPLGLDYGAVRLVARMTGARLRPALFADLRVMEEAALAAWAERLEAES